MSRAMLSALILTASCSQAGLPDADWKNLPRWRGFNFLEKFHKDWINTAFQENDFKWMSEWGFNFVRLPMDYRVWIQDGDWRRFNEDVLKEIDQALAWGQKYGIHVMINFHRAPGYTVADPKEKTSVWTDPETLEVCALYWGTFAKRYKDIPAKDLSFNPFNEPSGVDAAAHARVIQRLTDEIRKHSPQRLIICDGLNYGSKPSEELIPIKVGQTTRGYGPFQLTHYKANWVGDNAHWPVPTWPKYGGGAADRFYGSFKGELQSTLTLKGPYKQSYDFRIMVKSVSQSADLMVKADNKMVLREKLVSGPGEGPWKESVYREEWDVYQNIYDKEYEGQIPAGTQEITVFVGEGDWMTFSNIKLTPKGGGSEILVQPTEFEWGRKQGTLHLDAKSNSFVSKGAAALEDRDWHWRTSVEPWLDLRKKGVGVLVGEWGAYNKTPHDVTLRWMEDLLKNYKKADLGWALWNFRGSFGVLDSEREDVDYEDFRGHKLDRQMLELLRRY